MNELMTHEYMMDRLDALSDVVADCVMEFDADETVIRGANLELIDALLNYAGARNWSDAREIYIQMRAIADLT